MIITLKGKIKYIGLNFIILETGNIGYKIFVNSKTLTQISKKKNYQFYVHQHIRETELDLYGFLTFEELELFESLISISGIGPKAGLAILTRAKPDQIKTAILKDDLDLFTAVSGVGRKTATRIILELKGKISADDLSIIIGTGDNDDIIEALKNLGYKTEESKRALSKIPRNLKTSEEKIKWALQQLSKR